MLQDGNTPGESRVEKESVGEPSDALYLKIPGVEVTYIIHLTVRVRGARFWAADRISHSQGRDLHREGCVFEGGSHRKDERNLGGVASAAVERMPLRKFGVRGERRV